MRLYGWVLLLVLVLSGAAFADSPTIHLRLYNGVEATATPRTVSIPPPRPLTAAEADAVLRRLPPMAAPVSDKVPLRLREQAAPTAIQGAPFPPPPTTAPPLPSAVDALEILRHTPDGDVPVAMNVTITFSQPMVPITSLAELSRASTPAHLTPTVPGRWSWTSPQQLVFRPQAAHMPMGTRYTVVIPANTESVLHGRLAQDFKFTFATPPPRLIETWPDGTQGWTPHMALVFDQAVDVSQVLDHVRVTANGTPLEVRQALGVVDVPIHPPKGRMVILQAVSPLPHDAAIDVHVAPGIPSVEGPSVSTRSGHFSFRTAGPLKLVGQPRSWELEFSNPLSKTVPTSMVHVSPPIESFSAEPVGNTLYLSGTKRPRTTYAVTLDPGISDIYGQSLGHQASVTIHAGPLDATLVDESRATFTVLQNRMFPVHTCNVSRLRVRLYDVRPSDYSDFQSRRDTSHPKVPPGRLVGDTSVPVHLLPDDDVETLLDLSPALQHGHGQVIVDVSIDRAEAPVEPYEDRVTCWVSVTGIGLTATVDSQHLLAWTTSISSGKPLPGVRVALSGSAARTNGRGLATLALDNGLAPVLVASDGDDCAMLPANDWVRGRNNPTLRWFAFDDRHIYRPGEDVHLKGWVRRLSPGPRGLLQVPQDVHSLQWAVTDSRSNEVAKGTARVGTLGGFDITFSLPSSMHLGQASINFQIDSLDRDRQFEHPFDVQEFRRPEFEVATQPEQSVAVSGQPFTASVSARYYTGGGLPDAPVTWNVTAEACQFSPPGHPNYVFNTVDSERSESQSFEGRTDSHGKHFIGIECYSEVRPHPFNVTAEATVLDVNRHVFTSATTLLVHPATLYVGLAPDGETGIRAIVCDLDGRVVPGRSIRFRCIRRYWQDGTMHEEDSRPATVVSGTRPVSIKLSLPKPGGYEVLAEVSDSLGRRNMSGRYLWSGGWFQSPDGHVPVLVPDRASYQPGDIAHLRLRCPFATCEALVTTRHGGVAAVQELTVRGPSTLLSIPIDTTCMPSVEVKVVMIGPGGVKQDGFVELSVPPTTRRLSVRVAPRNESIAPGASTQVDVVVRDAAARPMPQADVALVAVDEAVLALSDRGFGDPLQSFYRRREGGTEDASSLDSLLIVDYPTMSEGLVGQDLRVALKRLTRAMGMNLVTDSTVRGQVHVSLKGLSPKAALQKLLRAAHYEYKILPGGKGQVDTLLVGSADTTGKVNDDILSGPASMRKMHRPAPGGGFEEPLSLRQDFAPLALFVPSAQTDAQGRVTVPVKLPGNLTRYRIIAMAAAGPDRFGSGDAALTVRLPLMVRPSAPRFLSFGDRSELPVMVQNQTDTTQQVRVAVRATNAQLPEGNGRSIEVPAHNRVEVRFPIQTVESGTARFDVAAVSNTMSDAASATVPVYTPATSEAFADYGVIDSGAVARPVRPPPDVYPQFGGLEVTTSSTQVGELTDALLYLQSYPYECTEQISSRIISVATLGDVLPSFHTAGLPSAEAMRAAVARDLARLKTLQHQDGGFSFWRADDETWPYVSVYVTSALVLARDRGYAVPEDMLRHAQSYLRHIDFAKPYSHAERRSIQAFALSVRARMGDRDPAGASAVVADGGLETLPVEAAGWLLPLLDGTDRKLVRHFLANHVEETAGEAHFTTFYEDGLHLLLYSEHRTDAVILEALMTDEPGNDLIPKLVHGLLAHRRGGCWVSTQENAFVLMAMTHYFHAYEGVTPDFVAQAWLGQQFAGEQRYVGHTTDQHTIDIPMTALTQEAPLTLAKSGAGRLYYRIGLRYAPRDLKLPALDRGFEVSRLYESLDSPEDVTRDADGVWHVKPGVRVRVRVHMVAPSRRYHVALVDPLPGGFEAENPDLRGTQSDPLLDSWDRWYEHDNLRDERAEAFASDLNAGSYVYEYICRATTPGTYLAGAPRAEEMYAPETFGRGAVDRVVVESPPAATFATAVEEEPPLTPWSHTSTPVRVRHPQWTTLVIPLEYCEAEDAAAAVQSSFPDLAVSKVPGQNMIMVKGYKDDVLGAKSLCSGLDRPPPPDDSQP